MIFVAAYDFFNFDAFVVENAPIIWYHDNRKRINILKGGKILRKTYLEPSVKIIEIIAEDILTASDDEIFVDGKDLFGDE